MSISSFCPNCGSKLESGAKFCKNCGSKIEDQSFNPNVSASKSQPYQARPNNFSPYQSRPQSPQQPFYGQQQYGGYHPAYAGPPIQYEQWEDGSIINTTVELYKNPERVAPSVLLSRRAPDPITLVFINGFLAFIGVFILDSKLRNALEKEVGVDPGLNTSPMIVAFLSPFLGYFVISWIVSFIMKADFPYGSEQHIQSTMVFRKIWGYLLALHIIAEIILIPIALTINPVITYSATSVSATTPDSYAKIASLLSGIAGVVNLTIFRKISKSIQNDGGRLTVITILWVIIIAFSFLGAT